MQERTKFMDGIHDIHSEQYHSSYGLNRSRLMLFQRSPYHFMADNLSTETKEPTEAMIFGNLAHCAVLEPHLLDENYIVSPKFDRRTKAGKFAACQFQATLAGRIPVSFDMFQTAQNMADVVMTYDMARMLIEDSDIERSIYFTYKGIQCKVRPDVWRNKIVVDYKTTNDASPYAFQSSAYKYGYYLQCGMIVAAMAAINRPIEKFVIIAQEKEPPHAIGIYDFDYDAMQYGLQLFDSLIDSYILCLETGSWPSYGYQTLTKPGYAKLNEVNHE